MSVRVMSAVFDRYPKASEMLLALALADHAHDDGTHIFPGVPSLAKKTRRSERAVQYQLQAMISAGWLVLMRQATGKRGQANEYAISPEWLAGGVAVPLSTGAKLAPVESVDNCPVSGAIPNTEGCNIEHPRVKPVAPKPSLTIIEPNTPLPPDGGERDIEPEVGRGIGDGFDRFLAAYPKKVDQSKAQREWVKLAPDAALQVSIIAAVLTWQARPEWLQDDGRWIPKPGTWLRNKRWTDVPGITPADGPATIRPARPPPDPGKPAAPMPESVKAYRASLGRRPVQASASVGV